MKHVNPTARPNLGATRVAMMFAAMLVASSSLLNADNSGAETAAITKIMRATWERPDAPLLVEPVVVVEEYAIAGWAQDKRGGRALLKRRGGVWEVILCGGDGLTEAEAVVAVGASPDLAARLAAGVRNAEARMAPTDRAKLSLFGGIVEVQPSSALGPGPHPPHGQGEAAPSHQK